MSLGFKLGSCGVRQCPQCSGQSPRLRQLGELVYFLEAGASHLLGRITQSALAQRDQAVKLQGALWLEETSPQRENLEY